FPQTNSRAFTAKTSCVRRRYREFAWLRRQLQKNAGLVPVPELPGKSGIFSGSSDEFIERRRLGLQQFLQR
ncbi:SNX11 protein, partial [Alaudala cheleensis]|nr:SNX11 protein [Alaudala cheleensis]